MALLLVFTAAAASLALEALLARYFALTQWHHLSFMVISVALLGFSASGAYLNLVATRQGWVADDTAQLSAHAKRRLRGAASGFAVSSIAMFVVLRLLPLDFFRIPSEPVQLVFLALSYLACAVPFFFAGLVTAVAFAVGAARPGAVYAAAMSGSAVGVLLPILLLPLVGLRAALLTPALLLVPLLCWPDRGARRPGTARRPWLAPVLTLLAVGLGVGVGLGHPAMEPQPGPFKYLSHMLRFPDTQLVARRDTARGRIDEVVGPTIRFAPGLSLGAGNPVPPQRALVRDGDAALFLVEQPAATEPGGAFGAWLEAIHPAVAFHLGAVPQSVLVLQEGGGVLLAAALRASPHVQVAVPSAAVARRLRRLPVPAATTLQVVEDEPRALARRLARAGAALDAVLIEDWGASLAGTESHTQEPLLTVEAFRDYLMLVEPAGLVSVSRRLLLPPANAPRLVAVAAQALRAAGRRAPVDHIAVIRNWDSVTLLVSPQPLQERQIEAVRSFVARHGFDLVALPGLREGESNRFNRLAEPFHARAVAAILATWRPAAPGAAGRESATAGAGAPDRLVDLRPPTDDRPFFNRFVRWRQLADYQRATGGRLYGLLLSGDVVALAVLAEALVLALVLLAIPWLRAGGGQGRGAPAASVVAYNLAVGLGFILLELMLIQRLTVALGDPVVSFKVVLGALLVWSAAGGLLSERVGRRWTWLAVAAIAGVVLIYAAAGSAVLPWLLGLPRPQRVAAIVVLLAPLGAALGMAFPLGLRLLAPAPATRALAWAANGCASVVGAVASTLLAVAQGITILGLVAAASYAVAALVAAVRAERPA